MTTDIVRRLRRVAVACGLAAGALVATAHGADVGDLAIGHPWAPPSLPGVRNGAAYVASIETRGTRSDRLVRATTPAADHVELHTMAMDAQGVMRMREVEGIAVEPKAAVRMQPGMGYHLMLIDLKQPLKAGDSFPMTLVFEHAGKVDVKVVVQVPRRDAPASAHMR